VTDGYYAQLARALLDAGDPGPSVARFLCVEYRLKPPEALEAIARGRCIENDIIERAGHETRVGYRATLRRRANIW
jgi:hypothetical protein